jgi:hypothetical protein
VIVQWRFDGDWLTSTEEITAERFRILRFLCWLHRFLRCGPAEVRLIPRDEAIL